MDPEGRCPWLCGSAPTQMPGPRTNVGDCRVRFTVIWTSWPSAVKQLDQTADGEIARAVTHQGGDVGLLDAEDCTGPRLRQTALLNDLIDFVK
jgi:hypothetical protein